MYLYHNSDDHAGNARPVLTNIDTDNGYRGPDSDKCVYYDLLAGALVHTNNTDICLLGLGVKAVCKKKIGQL